MRTLIVATFAFFFLSLGTANALVMTAGGPSCLTCDGSVITLEIIDKGGNYDVTLTLDSTDYDESREGLAQIGFGAIKNWTSVSVVSTPTSLQAWADPIAAQVSSNGFCANTNGNSGKICSHGFTDIQTDGEYVWEFNVVGGDLKLDEWYIGGQYANWADMTDDSLKTPEGKLISESGAPVPEPTAAVVFAAGMLVLGRGIRRRV